MVTSRCLALGLVKVHFPLHFRKALCSWTYSQQCIVSCFSERWAQDDLEFQNVWEAQMSLLSDHTQGPHLNLCAPTKQVKEDKLPTEFTGSHRSSSLRAALSQSQHSHTGRPPCSASWHWGRDQFPASPACPQALFLLIMHE